LVKTEPQNSQPQVDAPYVRGINPRIETNLTVLPASIVEGKFDVNDRGLLIGSEFAHNMNLGVGDRSAVYSPSDLKKWEESAKEGGKLPVPPEYDVRGIFDVGYFEYKRIGHRDFAAGRPRPI